MYRLIVLLALLAACRPVVPEAPILVRNPAAPIYSSGVLEPARLEGHWVQVATVATGGAAPCAPGTVEFQGGQVTADLCLASGRVATQSAFAMGRPGRLSVSGQADWWVLWVDADYRTLVIGTPGGQFGFVLNRDAALPGDRLKAVKDILTFNGYAMGDIAVFR